jgi:hypothetical protein
MSRPLALAALAFALLAGAAGVAQVIAFVATGWPRHLVVGGFALAVGVSVTIAVVRARRR